MEEPHVPDALAELKKKGLQFPLLETTYFLGRETLLPSGRPGMAIWRDHLFAMMNRNARTATSFFGLPPNRVVELGTQVAL
jgi:KUP system potassium uptake protein